MMPSFQAHRTTVLPGDSEVARVRRESEQRITRILESITDAFQVFDADWRITYMNPMARKFFAAHGLDPDAMIGKHFWDDLFPESGDTEAARHMRRAMTERVPVAFESYYAPWDIWLFSRFDPLPDGGLANYYQDITERKQIDERLRRSEARLAEAQQLARIGSWNWDRASDVVEWSDEQYRIFGLRPQEVVMTFDRVRMHVHPDDRSTIRAVARKALQDHQPFAFSFRAQHSDGTVVVLWARGQVVLDERGEPSRMFGTVQDITERRALEAVQRRLQRERDDLLGRLQLQFDRMPIACVVSDSDMRIMEWNPAAEVTFGYRREEVVGTDGLRLLVPPESRQQVAEMVQRLTSGDPTAHAVQENVTKDGRTIICEWHNTALRNAEGQVVAVLAMAQDITARNRAEEALRNSEQRFRHLFELGTVGRAITSLAKGCLAVNDGLCHILGYDRDELLRMTWPEMTHPDDRAADLAQFNRVLAGEIDGYSIDKRWIRKDGRVIDTTIWVDCVRRDDRSVDYFVALVQDITERKRGEEARRKSEERYRSLISQVRDYAIFSTDERGVVTTWNEGCQDVLGYAESEFVGLDTAELFTPQDRTAGIPAAALRQAVQEGTARNDRWMVARGGRRFFAMGATAGLTDLAGRLIGFSTVMRDVTSMKQLQDELAHHGASLERLVSERTRELEKTTQRLRLSERMASLGTLSAGLGHDLGNLLLPLDVRLQLLLQADLPADLHEHVVGIQKCAQYLQRLSTGLRLLAVEPVTTASEATELRSWWNDVAMMLEDVLPRGVRLEHELPESACWVAIGRIGLTQAVFNLVQNAADALKEGSSGLVQVSAAGDPGAGAVRLRVVDDGPGMTKEVARRCIEPYFSTKSRGVSTGMGLSFVHGLVTGVGGRVEVDSRVGRGTTITLMLPAAHQVQSQDGPPRVAVGDMKDARMRSSIKSPSGSS